MRPAHLWANMSGLRAEGLALQRRAFKHSTPDTNGTSRTTNKLPMLAGPAWRVFQFTVQGFRFEGVIRVVGFSVFTFFPKTNRIQSWRIASASPQAQTHPAPETSKSKPVPIVSIVVPFLVNQFYGEDPII